MVVGLDALADALLLVAPGALGMAFEGRLTFGAMLAEALRLADTDTLALVLTLLVLVLVLVLTLTLALLLMLLEALADALLVDETVGGALATLDTAEALMLVAGLLTTGGLPASSAAARRGKAIAPTTGAA